MAEAEAISLKGGPPMAGLAMGECVVSPAIVPCKSNGVNTGPLC